MPFQPGQLVGEYEILDILGRGGMGRVYRVRNVISDRTEAMKVLIEDIGAEAGVGDRFIAEIRTLARLDHPNIAKLNTAFKYENQLIMVMELVEGTNLAERAKAGAIPLDKALGYVQQVLTALAYAHSHGVVHRDIKPSNMMLTPQGVLKLMDFGIAKSNAEPLLTQPGTTMGSLQYMSPEQVRGTAVDARSDLYSVGIVLYELTAGRRPFEAESTYQILDAQLNAAPPPPIEVNSALPQALNEIILTALQKDPAQRFQNADAFRKVLEHVAGGKAPTVPFAAAPRGAAPAAVLPQTGKPAGKRSLWMAAGAVACLCVAAAAMVLVPHFRKGPAADTSNLAAQSAAPVSSSAPAVSTAPAASAVAVSSGVAVSVPPEAAATPMPPPATPEIKPENKVDSEAKAVAVKPAASGFAAAARTGRVAAPRVAASAAEAVQGQAAQAQSAQAQAVAPVPPSAPAGPSEEDLNNASEEIGKLRARVDAVNQGLASLKQQQAAQGFGLRGDIVASESRMYSAFQQAERAVQNRNLEGAQKSMDRTEQELSKLEAFLGR
jgi:eukaryotic-like serine/threonine-protein kinase